MPQEGHALIYKTIIQAELLFTWHESNAAHAFLRDEKPRYNPELALSYYDIVWVNTRSSIYHYPGYRWYGTTIAGKYTREEDALADGDRAALNEWRPPVFAGGKD